jgi:flagellin-like protein
MFESIDTDERGQVGIGTLIIFIAMVLVAAVAAGVLINTAGLLESSASDTAADSQAQVSNQVTVVSASGTTGASNNDVQTLDFTIMKSAGSDDIDLADATIEYSTEDVAKTLTFSASGTSGSEFGVFEIDGTGPQSAANAVLSDQSDRKVVRLSLASGDIGDVLSEGEEATVKFVDQSGATTIYGVNVPDTIDGETSVAV